MTRALSVTGADLIRALGNAAALPAIDAAVRERATAVAREIAGEATVTRVLKRGAGAYAVEISGEDVFAREFGSQAAEPEPFVASAIARAVRP